MTYRYQEPFFTVMDRVLIGDDCWEWTGYRSKRGYGQAGDHGRVRPVHQIVYEKMVGPIPADLELDHICENRSCVKPDHLEAVTHMENTQRRRSRHPKTNCVNGHEFTDANTYYLKSGTKVCRRCRADCEMRRSLRATAT